MQLSVARADRKEIICSGTPALKWVLYCPCGSRYSYAAVEATCFKASNLIGSGPRGNLRRFSVDTLFISPLLPPLMYLPLLPSLLVASLVHPKLFFLSFPTCPVAPRFHFIALLVVDSYPKELPSATLYEPPGLPQKQK